jgi:hypothetical protein
MPKYHVTHTVLCEVNTTRTIEAENHDDLLNKITTIETMTSTCWDEPYPCDFEIMNDIEIKNVVIKKI